MLQHIAKRELVHAQIALFVAIGLQVLVWGINEDFLGGPQYLIVATEIVLAILIGFTVNLQTARDKGLHHGAAIILLALISVANISSLIIVLQSLVVGHTETTGLQLLSSAIAIFITNIIVFALWYWEIDSPGLTRKRWSKHDKDFQFIQQDKASEFPGWKPEFIDYIFLSTINAFNGATTSANPLTHQAKLLMASQALVSVFTLAVVIARSVSILG